MRAFRKPLVLSLLMCSALLAGACDSAPADLREWKADDHDRVDQQPAGRSGRSARGQVEPSASASPTATLVEVTWRNQCASCHGMSGRGDGPQGPMMHATDLTQAEWQGKVTDQEIARTIQNGKNRMPKFDFPAEVLKGLIARIRASKAR